MPMRMLLVDDCIDNEREFYADGARYSWSIVNFAGLINVIDTMLAVKDLVFEDKTMTASELLENMRTGDERFLRVCRMNRTAFGRNQREANVFFGAFVGGRFFHA